MIRLDNVSKQIGHQILFIEASAALQKGEKVGLVGPNGAGKTTLFRMITGQELPDEGQVAVDRGVTIGYFSQDVGEMSGRSAVSEVMDGAGPVSAVAGELKELETAMADPVRADDMDEIIARYGEVQARFEDPRLLLGDRLKGIYRFLAEHGERLFPDDYFADMYSDSRRGRPTVPARVLATVMILQAREGLSDQEAVDRLERDLAWQAAAGVHVCQNPTEAGQKMGEIVKAL